MVNDSCFHQTKKIKNNNNLYCSCFSLMWNGIQITQMKLLVAMNASDVAATAADNLSVCLLVDC